MFEVVDWEFMMIINLSRCVIFFLSALLKSEGKLFAVLLGRFEGERQRRC